CARARGVYLPYFDKW
nr:immunoglobulin heavy chain junction region [Macaca mulatta]MOW76253.1 immunoglobulin heavy chain junction region [Macaca mulatta]MOW76690.1 immunoglobulin heavy chain junction region [Macaca mulatta]MOW77554.1 immunoglobulin heavy chain junction region [Macaca mulatta]MOW77714.1 immunoglobulin heavy chain junction region [Macaca mulatta]